MKKHLIWLMLLIALVACKRDKEQPNPDPDLPPATQIGANTFGCYINGQPWTPKGRVGQGANLYSYYDANYMDGNFHVSAYRVLEDGNKEYIAISSFALKNVGEYNLAKNNQQVVSFKTATNQYYNSGYEEDTSEGKLTITRFDLQSGIISGTFHFKLEKQGHPTIEATQGRFDLKL